MRKVYWIIVVIIIVLIVIGIGAYYIWGDQWAGKKESKLTGEEAILKVRDTFVETAPLNCQSTYKKDEENWRVICQGEDYDQAGIHYDFNYAYYTVDENGQVMEMGSYFKQRDAKSNITLLGTPMWGIPK